MRLPTNEEELISLIKDTLLNTFDFPYISITTKNENERLPSDPLSGVCLEEEEITVELTFRRVFNK